MVTILLAVLAVGVITAVITDLKTGMIYNWLTIPLWIAGLAINYKVSGWVGIPQALAAGLLTVVTTFRFSTPGGGDLKLGMAVGAWIGFSGWPVYFVGMALTRVLLSLLVKIKVYGVSGILSGLKYELITWSVPALGSKNFALFQNAARQAGYFGENPVVPGAIWVAGGSLIFIIHFLIGKG
ncbi:MAG: prepilin peptidase [Bacillota bacterium]